LFLQKVPPVSSVRANRRKLSDGVLFALRDSINLMNARLGHVAVLPVTGTAGPEQTHIPLTADAGLSRYRQSYADVTALQPVARASLLARRGLLASAERDRL
jgi:mRNA interferase MazF